MKASLSVLCLVLLVSVLEAAVTTKPNSGIFIGCLRNRTSPENPITDAIFTADNTTTFLSSYVSYTRNKRYSSPNYQKLIAIVAAKHVSHVQATVICAKTNGIQLRIRSGGHDYEGLSYTTLGELYTKINEASQTLAFPAGVCPTVGVGGHISGGGFGNLMRKFGITVDHVIDAQLINCNGKLLDRATMGEDLFWAIRGGGGASFGVILSWKINLVEVPKILTVFKVRKTLEQGGTDVLYKWQLVASKFPEDLFIRAWPQIVKGTKLGKRTIAVVFFAQFLGPTDKLMAIMSQSLPELGLRRDDCHEMSWFYTTLFWANYPVGTPKRVLLDRPSSPGEFFKSKSDNIKKPIPKEGLEKIWKTMLKFNFETENKMTMMKELYEVAGPYVSSNPREALLNFRDVDIGSNPSGVNVDEAKIYGYKYFLGNLKRLMDIKAKCDAENFFKNEQSISPARVM
ncbi:unnamed protein product [Arabidopsis lyrata]|uniref:Predicted protein n=1 Tax=Arabidopsis lyrata subsp. lyrata TaxID=81972 RepID=D7KQR0_ARALL|nr:predicted protein [Arabidopsis lyrata subsp. lyrata]CAH8253524.1 unnamed protein product [Arabidopsis lyrata]